MKVRVHSLIGLAVLCAAAASCGRPSPVAPTAAASAALLQGQQTAAPASAPRKSSDRISTLGTITPLLAGSLSIVNADGDGISGTYTGTAQSTDLGTEIASLTITISGGSGAFAGAAGTLAMTGAGAWVDEGSFLLKGGGELSIAGGKSAVVMIGLRGTAVASCDSSGHTTITANAEGVMGRAGRVSATLRHEVGNAGCGA